MKDSHLLMTMTKTIVNKNCHRNSNQNSTCLLSLFIYGSLFVSLLQAFIFVWKVAKICQIFWSSQCFAEMTLIPKKVFFCNILQIQLIPKFISSPSLFTICSYMSFRCGFLRREAFDGFAEELDHILVITNRPEKKI